MFSFQRLWHNLGINKGGVEMSRKAKRTNEIYFEGETKFTVNELPEGYFYKNHFYTENKCFAALLKDDEVKIHRFPNGIWEFNNTFYPSLKELYEWNENEIASPYNEFKSHYEDFGVIHDPINCTMYTYDMDEENELFDTKDEVLMEIRNETRLIEDTDDREVRYLEDKTKEECITYFKKPIKERIKILEDMK